MHSSATLQRYIRLTCVACLLTTVGCKSVSESDDRQASLDRVRQRWPSMLASARLRANDLRASFKATPSHQRDWRTDLTVLPYAEISSDKVRLFNIRDCIYRTEDEYDVRHFDREIKLADVQTIDFIVVPFKETPLLAHTMLSFGFADGTYLVFSVEARLQKGQGYDSVGGATNQFELMYIVGTEEDLIRLRTHVRKVDVYLYPIRATPAQVQKVFLGAIARVNQIARQPEFYDLITNNCTTNIVDLINSIKPGGIPDDLRVRFPGHSDKFAYDLGLLAVQGPFDQIKAACKINLSAELNYDAHDFSKRIRQR